MTCVHCSVQRRLMVFLFTSLVACADDVRSARSGIESPGIVAMTDLNDLPDVVEVSLVAGVVEKRYLQTGVAQVWGYRDGAKLGSAALVPGPLIEANQGDRVVVHFRNELPEGTTVHWHGLRVPNASDGTPSTQVEVPPGGEFRYEFEARDEGTFWYHPHVRGDSQVERGLYGMIVVRGGPRIPVTSERAIVLDDVKLNASGTLSDSITSLDIMLGRLGNFILANGIVGPVFHVESGSRERWRVVNSANGRYFNLRLPGHSFKVIGWDGGLLHTPYSVDTLLVAPGERYDVLVELRGERDATLALETIHYDRGHEIPDPGPQPVLTLKFSAHEADPLAPLPPVWGPPADVTPSNDAAENRLVFEELPINDGEDVRFTFNGRAFPDGLVLTGREGDVNVWVLENLTEMDHPFHLHGMFFRVLDVNGIAPQQAGWKDTVNVPQKSTLRFVVRYGEPGAWMFHCHILEHAERGMMGEIHLGERLAASKGELDGGAVDASLASGSQGGEHASGNRIRGMDASTQGNP